MQYPGPNENLTSDGVARGVPPWRLAFGVWRVGVSACRRWGGIASSRSVVTGTRLPNPRLARSWALTSPLKRAGTRALPENRPFAVSPVRRCAGAPFRPLADTPHRQQTTPKTLIGVALSFGCATMNIRSVNPKSAPVSVAEHYQSLLADRYSWMFGSFEQKAAEQEALFKRLSLHHDPKGPALDLGCGSGFQSIALARLGFEVTSIDFSERLLEELTQHQGSLPITALHGDFRDLREFPDDSNEVVACMGDSLIHLPARSDIPELFREIKRILKPGGKVIISFRDVNAELKGLDRFIPIKSDAERIMTCVLEYETETVVVTDLFYERTQSGWSFHKSSYRKLRIAPSAVAEELRGAGLAVTFRDVIAGFQILAAVKNP